MFALYKQLLPSLGGYLTHAGELNRGRLETFMRHLAEAEADVLHARAEVGHGAALSQGCFAANHELAALVLCSPTAYGLCAAVRWPSCTLLIAVTGWLLPARLRLTERH